MKTVCLQLARNPDNPDGNESNSYELHVLLDAVGKPDLAESNEQLMTFSRLLPGAEPVHGQVVRQEGGGWAFSYEVGDADDEPIIGFDTHRFEVGNYLTVLQEGGTEHVYRVVSVEDRHL